MKRTRFQLIAAVSAALLATAIGTLSAARRPRYGGDLRIEIRAQLQSLDPSETLTDALTLAAQRQIVPAVFETLVRLDERGDPQPWLAESWTHDPTRKSWIFTARRNVTFHDGTPWLPPGGSIVAADDRPIDQILLELARPRNAIVMRATDGTLLGTGPFRIARWEAGRSATLAANDKYWGGRPFLDSISIQMGRAIAEQAADFQVGKADVVELSVRDLRATRPRGIVTFTTPAAETLALEFEKGGAPDAVREALALSIDRSAIHSVLLQKQGEPSGALLPQWLSGASFLFPAARNLARARQLATPAPAPMGFFYDRQDPVIRAIAERIAVNASEAGITLRAAATAQAPLRLTRLPVTSRDPASVLDDFAGLLRLPAPAATANLYEAERALMGSFQVIPLFHLPQGWMLQPRVKDWPNWADAWLEAQNP